MDANEQVIERFYTAFQSRDYAGMTSCYSNDVVFFDPVFGLLNAAQVKAMWEMLCKSAKDLTIEFGNITNLGDDYYTCNWTASYTFSRTGKKVVNNIKAYMRFNDNKIIEHSDGFSIHKWSKQAFGLTGFLFGWNPYFQRKIKNSAHKNLLKFMESNMKM